jgi:hypothetical protein
MNGFQTLGRFPGGHNHERRFKSGLHERVVGGFGVLATDVGVGDDGAALAEFEARAFRSEFANQAGPILMS